MAQIEVTSAAGDRYDVHVDQGQGFQFTVTAPKSYCEKLAGEEADPAHVVEASFRFLLDREPASSILKSFELCLINRYFPEYEQKLKTYL